MATEKNLLADFDRIRIISLPARFDRRRSVTSQLASLGVAIDGQRVAFHDAVRPLDAGAFDSIGARGCFLSHLEVLRDAHVAGAARLLILEDDVGFSRSERAAMPAAFSALAKRNWGMFYGGNPVVASGSPLTPLSPTTSVPLTHFVALSGVAIEKAVPYLKAMLARPAGSAEGGPMHVDGAYNWIRRAHPAIETFAATPHLAHQLASRTDIHARRGLDRVAGLRPIVSLLRAARNKAHNRS